MKTFNKLFIAALATTAMTACNNDLNNNSLNSDRTVNFTMGIGETVSSRISMNDGEYTAKFSPNNSVGIFVKEQGSYKNLEYTTTDGTTWDGPQINLTEGETYTYYAYYPYSSEVNAADAIAINVATDQETGGYLANDYLYCNKQSAETNVTLEYKHALSLVDVTLTGDAIGENATVSIINVATDATLNVTAPSVTTGSTLGDVKMDVLTNTKNFRAIIPAQTIAASTPIFRIVNEGRTYEAKYSGEISFAEGKYLALTITIGEAGGEPTININVSGSISDWGEGSSTSGDVTIDEVPLISELPSAIPTLGTDAVIEQTSSTWFNIINKELASATISEAEVAGTTPEWENQANLTFNSTYADDGTVTSNSWYGSIIGYYLIGGISIEEKDIYELSFKAKGTNVYTTNENPETELTSSEVPQLYLTCRNADNSASFSIRNNTDQPTATNSTIKLNDDGTWKTCKFYIHFYQKGSEKSPGTYGDKYTKVETSPTDYSKIQIRINTQNKAKESEPNLKTSISITDVKLVPYAKSVPTTEPES